MPKLTDAICAQLGIDRGPYLMDLDDSGIPEPIVLVGYVNTEATANSIYVWVRNPATNGRRWIRRDVLEAHSVKVVPQHADEIPG